MDIQGPADEAVAALQRHLIREHGARILADGIAGPFTVAATRDVLRHGAGRLPSQMLEVAQYVSKLDPPATTFAWLLDGRPDQQSENLDRLAPDQTLFWRNGPQPLDEGDLIQLGTCDSVLLAARGAIVALGIVLAGTGHRFRDRQGDFYYPVRVTQVLARSMPFDAIKGLHTLASRATEFGIAELDGATIEEVAQALRSTKISDAFPLRHERAYTIAMHRPFAEDLAACAETIRPDDATADAIGWTGFTTEDDFFGDGGGPKFAPQSDKTGEGNAKPPVTPDESDARFPLVLDAPSDSEDELERGPFALFLAKRLHLIWCQINGYAPGGRILQGGAEADTFIVHVDSPWGGGKTTFANFIARVLDPRRETLSERHFLRSSLAPTDTGEALAAHDLAEVFVPDYAIDDPARWPEATRPWIVARYNAWRDQNVLPPWWHLFQTIEGAISREVLRESVAVWRTELPRGHRFAGARRGLRRGAALLGHRVAVSASALGRWAAIWGSVAAYKVLNSKVKAQLLLLAVMLAVLIVLQLSGVVDRAFAAIAAPGSAVMDPKDLAAWVALATAVLGVGGASIGTLLTVIAQSFSPDLDFTAEHRSIGVRDPISRFRRMFHAVLRRARRPVLLVVDDLDRCEPRAVVEILRGFQTVVRSPRLFVLLLGDREWIKNAHDVHHKDFAQMRGAECGLGSLFVQKVIQLSFRLPTMKDDARARFARGVLGDRFNAGAAGLVRDALERVDRELNAAVSGAGSVAEREALVDAAKDRAKAALSQSADAAVERIARTMVDDMANARLVAAAGSDARQQQTVAQAVERLMDSLPNNPRQIKRIFMAFATYEAVGRTYFGYRLTVSGPDGQRKARRWRQLAMWVTLATEWPDTWRQIARRPLLADAAFGDAAARKVAERALLDEEGEGAREGIDKTLRRLRSDKLISTLLGARPGAADEFAGTALETAAVREFNRIIWEPGFPLVERDG